MGKEEEEKVVERRRFFWEKNFFISLRSAHSRVRQSIAIDNVGMGARRGL